MSLRVVASLNLIILAAPLIGFAITEYLQTDDPTITQVALTNYLVSVVWPILKCALILQISTVYNHSAFIRFCSHAVWTRLNKLGLCIYLIHWEVIVCNLDGGAFGASDRPMLDFVRYWIYIYVVTLVFSIPAYFFIEAPMSRLLTMLIDRAKFPVDKNKERRKARKPIEEP